MHLIDYFSCTSDLHICLLFCVLEVTMAVARVVLN